MKNAVKIYTFLTLIFLLLYIVAGLLSGVLSDVVRIAAFALPVALGYVSAKRLRREREELAGVAEREYTLFELQPASALPLLSVIAPTVLIVFLLSWLTSLLLGALGFSSTTPQDAPLWQMLLVHALMPTVLEEMMFRYLPMKILAPYSRRTCVMLSSVYFAAIHMNLFQIPYALVAGAILIVANLALGSVWPSLVLHFVNNAASVLFIKYSASREFLVAYIVILVGLAVASLIPILIYRKRYAERIKYALDRGETLTERTAPMTVVLLAAAVAIMNLFS